MVENREFIAAKDLPVTEAEEVNVLVVDPSTGELAQKAGANLGGGSTKADLVIRINTHAEFATMEYVEIVSGSVEAVYTAFESGAFPVVEVESLVTLEMDSYWRGANKFPATVVFYGDKMYVSFVGVGASLNSYVCRLVYDSTNNYALTNCTIKNIATSN